MGMSFLDYKVKHREHQKEGTGASTNTSGGSTASSKQNSGNSTKSNSKKKMSFLDYKVAQREQQPKQSYSVWDFSSQASRPLQSAPQMAAQRQITPEQVAAVRNTLPAFQQPLDPVKVAAANMLRQYGKGNIDLYNRPQYRQPDGSISTVNSISIGTDDGEVLIPTIGRDAQGRPVQWTDQQAIDNYYKTGEHLGKFKTPEEADRYADRLHRQQEAYYDNSGLMNLTKQMPKPYEVGAKANQFKMDSMMYKEDPEADQYIEKSIRTAQNPFIRRDEIGRDPADESVIFGMTGGKGGWMQDYNVQQNLSSDEYKDSKKELDARRALGQNYNRSDYDQSVFNNMTPDEQKEYSYRLGKFGREDADRYFQTIAEGVTNREARRLYDESQGNLGKTALLAGRSGLDMVTSGVGDKFTNYVTGANKVTPASAVARASAMRKEDLNGPARIAYDVAENSAMMAPTTLATLAASVLMPPLAPAVAGVGAEQSLAALAAAKVAQDAPQIFGIGATMFPMSAGQGYEEAIEKGADPNKARLFGTLEGLNQAGLEYLLGGFEDLSGGYAKQMVDNALGNVVSDSAKSETSRTVARAIQHFLSTPEGRMLFSMGSEGFEEIVQGSVSNALNNVFFNENNAPVSQEDLYSALIASLSAGVSNARYFATGYANGVGKVYSAEDLRTVADSIVTDRAAYRNQEEYEAAMEQRETLLNQADYVEQGGKLTPLEKAEAQEVAGGALAEMDKLGRQVKTDEDIKSLTDALEEAKGKATSEETKQALEETAQKAVEIQKRRAENQKMTDAEMGRFISDTMRTSFTAEIESYRQAQEIEAKRKAEAGNRLGLGESGSKLYESINPEGQKADALVATYDEARFNIPRNEMQKDLASTLLTPDEVSAMYRAGIEDRNAFYNTARSEKIAKVAEKYRPADIKAGNVTYDGVDIEALKNSGDEESRNKYAQMEVVSNFLSKVLGYNVEWFESQNVNGKYKGENGSYTRSKHQIRLDVNAGAEFVWDKARFANVIAHELTHSIEYGSPEQYKKLADTVMKTLVSDEEYSRGRNAEQIIAEMIGKNEHVHNEADAVHELVAQACEDLMNGNAEVRAMFDSMSETERKTIFDKIADLFEAIKNFFDDLLDSEEVRSDRTEAEAIRRARDSIEDLQKAWTEGVKQAAAYNAAFYEESQKQQSQENEQMENATAETAAENDPAAQFAQENNSKVDNFSIRQLAQAAGYDIKLTKKGKIPYAIVDKSGHVLTKNEITPEVVKQTPMGKLIEAALENGTIDEKTAEVQRQMFADLFGLIYEYKDAATVWQIASTVMYSGYDDNGRRKTAGAVKSNSDPQYGTTVDFGTICAKTQAIIDAMSDTMLKKRRGLTRNEIVEIVYPRVSETGLSVPCPVCYVFSRWLGVPSLLNTMLKSQERFKDATDDEINAYIESIEKKYGNKKLIGTKKSRFSRALQDAQKSATLSMAKIDSGKLTEKDLAREQKKLDGALARMKKYDAQISEIEAYNWVTQVLCETNSSREAIRDENGKVHKDPDFNKKGSPNRGYVDPEILLDMRRTGEFAEQSPKGWLFRTTRGAGMGKAIMPYSGEEIGDIIRGSNTSDPTRFGGEKNPFINAASKDAKTAAAGLRDAISAIARGRERAKAQNLIGGLRLQSTSDFRAEWGVDYMMTFFEMQAIGSQGQLYTKVIEAVDLLASSGCECNLSIMGRGNGYYTDKNGDMVLDFSSVTGIDFDQAYEKTKQYDNVQLILVGMNNDHIRLAMADDRIGFIIPWHSSGSSERILGALMKGVKETLKTGTDYSPYQSDIILDEKVKADVRQLRLDILMGEFEEKGKDTRKLTDAEKKILKDNKWLASLYNRFYEDKNAKEYGIHLNKDQAEHIFPYEYWDTSLTYDQADENGRRFVEYCDSLGIAPRFSGHFKGKKGQAVQYSSDMDFTKDKGYWKTLIDRRMYNRDGTYHEPKAIDITQIKVNNIDIPKQVNSNSYNDKRKINRSVKNIMSDLQRNEETANTLQVNSGTQMSARENNPAIFEGKAFWSGSVSLTDGVIEEVHTYEEAEQWDFHHSMYFSSAQQEKMREGENAFFFVDRNGNIDLDDISGFRDEIPDSIIRKIKRQIKSNRQQMSARDSAGSTLTEAQAEYFKDSKVRDKNGNLKVMYHGTARADRVGTVFDPNRATSGPMAYFTDDESIAKNYASDKEDTSLSKEGAGDYHRMYRMKVNGKTYTIEDAWDKLTTAQRNKIRKVAPHVTFDDYMENIIVDDDVNNGLGNFDNYLIRHNGGNYIKALIESWLDDGTLYGDEERFREVLFHVGLEDVEYLDTKKRDEKVYAVYLNVTNPLNTSQIPQNVIDSLEEKAAEAEWSGPDSNVDMWDKTNISPEAWMDRFREDLNNGTAYVWTQVPDWVTDTLKEMGYDGISDTGGKRGGATHQVVIPFYSEQIKNVDNQNPTTDRDIRYSYRERIDKVTEDSMSAMLDNGYTQKEADEAVETGGFVQYSTRTDPPPKRTITAYKAFYAMDGKLYPPMVANDAEEEQNKGKKKVSGTLKGMETPVGIWIDADVGALAYGEDGKPLRNTKGRLAVKNAKGGGTLAFRPGWHLGLWPDAKQFNVKDPVTGETKACMPDGLVFARCSVAADYDYQLEALGYGMQSNGKFNRTQAGLPRIPVNGYYMYRTNVDPTTAPWIISGAIRVEEILDDDMAAEICKQYGITADPRASHKKINLADYGLKAGPVTPTTDTDRFLPNDAVRANAEALEAALNDENYADAYVANRVNFDDPEIIKELARNNQNAEFYKEAQEKYGNKSYEVNDPNDSLIDKNTFKTASEETQYSARDSSGRDLNFYSKLQQEVQNFKGNKLGAASVESYLKGKGVKDEEIKWSGIRTFLEGKKSVSKQELMDYLKANELEIKEEVLGEEIPYFDADQNRYHSPEEFFEAARQHAKEAGYDPNDVELEIDGRSFYGVVDGEVVFEAYKPDPWDMGDAGYDENGTKWSEYKLNGGDNYREILFKVPGSDYSNNAMRTHWNESGVLAHARVQDFNSSDGGKVLFVEEIQSDWHNAGQKYGYWPGTEEARNKRVNEIKEDANSVGLPLYEEKRQAELDRIVWKAEDALNKKGMRLGAFGDRKVKEALLENLTVFGFRQANDLTKLAAETLTDDERLFIETYKEDLAYQNVRLTEAENLERATPDAPFRNNYTDFVLKDLLRMAAEGDYDYLAWTTGKMQEDRWSSEFAEGYRIEYDQQIPKFLKKYGKQWGAGLTDIELNTGKVDDDGNPRFDGGDIMQTVPAIVVNDAMKDSVLAEGQSMFSQRLDIGGENVELTEREEKLLEQLNDNYLKRIDKITAQKDAEIAELEEKMKAAVGAEKQKAKERLEKLRREKNNKIAYLEKSYRQNLNWQIATMKQKMEKAVGDEKKKARDRLERLRAQKNQRIDEIIQGYRDRKADAREKRKDRKLRVKFQELAQKALRESKNKPGYAAQAVQDLLKDIDLKALGMREDTKWELRRKYQEIEELRKTDANYAALFADRDMKKVERLFKKQIKDMSIQELADLITELSALVHYQETTDKLLGEAQTRSAVEVGRQIVQDMKELKAMNLTSPINVLLNKYLRNNLSPERAFRMLSGYKHDSAMEKLYHGVIDGHTAQKEFEQKSDELFKPFYDDKKNKDFLDNGYKQTIPVTDSYGRTALISPAMRVSLYMASKNTDNLRHIATDGVTIPEPKLYHRGMVKDAYGRGTTLILQPTEIETICKDMTESEEKFADLLATFFDTYAKDAINDTSVTLDGILKATVDNYFPISSDPNFLAKSMEATLQDPTLEGWNNLKARQDNANNKVLLEDARQVLQRHVRNTARYAGLAVPMRNFNKVFDYTSHKDETTGTRNSVRSAIANTWNEDTIDYIDRLIREDINAGGRKMERGGLEFMRSAYAGAALTLNLGVAAKQTTSYTMAGSILDTESLAYGLAHRFTDKDRAYMDSITPWGWARRQGQSTIELGDMAKRQDPITKRVPNLNQMTDVWTTDHLFLATERSVQKEFPNLKRGDKQYDDALAERYNQVVWRTQPQYEAAFRPEYLRKTDILSRTFGMFKTESMQMAGELIDAWGQWQADTKRAKNGTEADEKNRKESAKHFYKTLASWAASNMLFAIMGTALNIALFHKGKPYRDDKGEITMESIASKVGQDFIGSSVGGVFFASTALDFATYLYNSIAGEKATWYDIEAPGMSLINDAVNNMGNMIGVLTDEEANSKAKAQAIAKLGLSLSKFTPVGFAENLTNLANSVVLYGQDIKDRAESGEWHPYEAGDGLLKNTAPTKREYANQAVYYANQGDVDRVARALEKTNKDNLEKAIGRKMSKTMYESIMDDPTNLQKYLGINAGHVPKLSEVPDHGFSSFTQLRQGIGDPEMNQQWHHIVEQEQMNKELSGFPSTQVNNTNNIVSIPSSSRSPHGEITNYYNSVQDFTDGKTVREWLAGKSFEEQFDFGMEQLRKYGDVVPTSKGWVFVPKDKEEYEAMFPENKGALWNQPEIKREWDTKIAETRDDGTKTTDREIRDVALLMISEGLSAEDAQELYKGSKKNDKYLEKWHGSFEDYLKSRNAIDDAKAITDKDKKKAAEKRKKAVEDYLRQYHGTEEDELMLWKMMNYSENTFTYR